MANRKRVREALPSFEGAGLSIGGFMAGLEQQILHRRNFLNEGSVALKLYTVYAPPRHAPGTIHRTKAEADVDQEHA